MVLEYDITNIFMMCQLRESGKSKCDKYYPTLEEQVDESIEPFCLSLIYERQVSEQIIKRRIRVENLDSGLTTTVNIY